VRLVRLRPLSEAEAYARCYGRGDENVKFVRLERRPPRFDTGLTGEDLRRAFEVKLDSREPAHVPAPEAVNGSEPAAAA